MKPFKCLTLLTIITVFLCTCSKENASTQKQQTTYKSLAGNWKYASDSFNIAFTIMDSVSAYWVIHSVIGYKGVTYYQFPVGSRYGDGIIEMLGTDEGFEIHSTIGPNNTGVSFEIYGYTYDSTYTFLQTTKGNGGDGILISKAFPDVKFVRQ